MLNALAYVLAGAGQPAPQYVVVSSGIVDVVVSEGPPPVVQLPEERVDAEVAEPE